ncbi:MAG: hypothetical protein ACPGJV_13050 [Bacteriovoracaceae bacterium]
MEFVQETSPEYSRLEKWGKTLLKDIEAFISGFDKPSTGLSELSKRSKVSTRTLYRVTSWETRPTADTVLKIYKGLLGSKSEDILSKLPKSVREFILKIEANENPHLLTKTTSELLVEEMKVDSYLRRIYLETIVKPIHPQYVFHKWGKEGQLRLNKLISNGFLTEDEENPGCYKRGSVRSEFSTELLAIMGVDLLQNDYKPENSEIRGENFIQTWFANVNEEGYNEILKIRYEAYLKEIAITEDDRYQGDTYIFTHGCIDKLNIPQNKGVEQ